MVDKAFYNTPICPGWEQKKSPIVMEGWGRRDLYRLFNRLNFTQGAEIGVQRGRNAAVILDEVPSALLYLIEPYRNSPFSSTVWKERDLQKFRNVARKRLMGRRVSWIEEFSECAANAFTDYSLDFVYIDGDHAYDFVMLDLILWSRKVRPGGIVSGHDYYYRSKRVSQRRKVTGAVNDFVDAHAISPWYLTDHHRQNPEAGDLYPSWFWINP